MKLKNLIINDDATIQTLIKKTMLYYCDCEVHNAFSYEEALPLINASQYYDCIVLDGNMPKMHHGRELLAQMTPLQIASIIICSTDILFKEECMKNGMLVCEQSNFREVFEMYLKTWKKSLPA